NKIPGVSALIRSVYQVNNPKLEREVFGLKFNNPVGLAAGLDKDAKIYNELNNFGFGFIEIGTITPKQQDGNPKKRLFRLKEDKGARDGAGLKGSHVRVAVERLKKADDGASGRNLRHRTATPTDQQLEDYQICFNEVDHYLHDFVGHGSAPNRLNLGELQDR